MVVSPKQVANQPLDPSSHLSHHPLHVFYIFHSFANPLTLFFFLQPPSDTAQFSSVPQHSVPGLDFESAVLMRMRQTERELLEREIREQEANEA